MENNTKEKPRWIVADLSVRANEIVAKELGSSCDENQIDDFTSTSGTHHRGYYVPNYSLITGLKHLSKGKDSGITYTVFKQCGERFVHVPFDSKKKKKKHLT